MRLTVYEMDKHTVTKMTIISLSFLYLLACSRAISNRIGVNFGRVGNNLPPPSRSIELLQIMKAGRVKLYDADHEILQLLSTTNIEVTVMVTNEEISGIANNQQVADQWVHEHIINHYPATMIRYVLVGNEVLSYTSTDQDMRIMRDLVPAMGRIRTTLKTLGINNIKVGTPLAMDIMESTFPPSSGVFKPEIVNHIVPLLNFLRGTNSFFFLDVYPFLSWADNPTGINLDYALFEGNQTFTDMGSGLTYTNLLDQMIDSVYFAMAKLGYNNVKIAIAETGWPHGGGSNQQGASKENAAKYNRNVIKKMAAVPPKGTPAQPGFIIPTFIFSMYDENEKTGPESERHWGLLYPDGTPVYEVDLSGKAYKS
ncbi:putative glucan endo-1,3-beta-D-glucosidase [Helianthus anomalus]